MKQHWEKLISKVDAMSLRERVLIFAAAAFLLVSLAKALFLAPLLEEQKKLSTKVAQQQEKMKEVQARIDASLQARKEDENSPQRHRLELVKQQLADGDAYLQGRREHLVEPEQMADLLEQVLNQNGRLQLVNLQTMPVALLNEKVVVKSAAAVPVATAAPDQQVFKHGVQITVRGSYLDLLQYLTEIEHLPAQMFWGKADMKVEQPSEVVLTLTLYTLSLDKTWLQI